MVIISGAHHFVEGDILLGQIGTFSSLAYLSSFLNFNFIKFSLKDSYLYLLNVIWKVIQGLWIKEKTSVNVCFHLVFLSFFSSVRSQIKKKKKILLISTPILVYHFRVWRSLHGYIHSLSCSCCGLIEGKKDKGRTPSPRCANNGGKRGRDWHQWWWWMWEWGWSKPLRNT